MPGTLIVKPIQAKLKHDRDFLFNKQDPYCIFVLGKQSVKSSVCQEGGKTPKWKDTLTLSSNNEPVLYVKLMDKDTFKQDDDIGVCQIDLKPILSFSKGGPQWYRVFYKQQLEGEILIDITYNPGTSPFYGNQAPGGVPTQNGFQAPTYVPTQPPATYLPTQHPTTYSPIQMPNPYPQTQGPVTYPPTQMPSPYPQTQGPTTYPPTQMPTTYHMGQPMPAHTTPTYPVSHPHGYPTQGYPPSNMTMFNGRFF